MKEARVSWNKSTKQWVIRYWSEKNQEWNEDSYYFVKDVNPNTEMGWVSESLLTRMYELQDLGYTITLM